MQQIDGMGSVARARGAGLTVDVRVPHYAEKSWRGVPADNAQIYPGWVTPADHPAVVAAVDAWRRVASPQIPAGKTANFRVAFPGVPDFASVKFDAQGRGFKPQVANPGVDETVAEEYEEPAEMPADAGNEEPPN